MLALALAVACLAASATALAPAAPLGRRAVLAGGASAAAAAGLAPLAGAADSSPIVVLGASGKTGALVCASCIARGIPVRALTRTGKCPEGVDASSPLLTLGACDVRSEASLAEGVRGARGVVYAASASKNGGKAKEIDNLGVVAAGKASIAEKVARFAVISSLAVTRPKSLGYKFTNVFGGIMDEKRFGEEGLRAAYAADASKSSYTIVRPGGLDSKDIKSPGALEISQGDLVSGIVSRADLAETMVEVILSPAPGLADATFELYYAEGASASEGRFGPALTDGSLARLRGSSWPELFKGVKSDGQFSVPV